MKVYVIEHQPDAHLGSLGSVLAESVDIEILSEPPAGSEWFDDDVSGIVTLGGEMGAWEEERCPFIPWELAVLRAAHERGTPVLGICLGAQMLARALGGEVRAGVSGEIGWCDLEVAASDRLVGEPGPRRVFQWHYDSLVPPPDAEVLAASEECPHEAFRAGNSYGFQWHPEVDAELLRQWLSTKNGRDRFSSAGLDPDAAIEEGAVRETAYRLDAERIGRGFAALVRRRAAR